MRYLILLLVFVASTMALGSRIDELDMPLYDFNFDGQLDMHELQNMLDDVNQEHPC